MPSILRLINSPKGFRILPLLGLLFATIYLSIIQSSTPKVSTNNCGSILKKGKYLDNTNKTPIKWQPTDCSLREYTVSDIRQCFPPGSELIFFGDSTNRQIYWAMCKKLDPGFRDMKNVHGNMDFVKYNISLRLFWDPYFNQTPSYPLFYNMSTLPEYNNATRIVYTTTGLWHLMFERRERVLLGFQNSFDNFLDLMRNRTGYSFDQVIYGPTQLPYFQRLDQSRDTKITKEYFDQIMEHTEKQFNYDEATDAGGVIYRKADPKSIGVEYAPVMNKVGGNYNNPKQLDLYDHIGLHYLDTVTNVQADLILNKFCNNRIGSTHQIPHNTTCCFDYKNEGLAQSSGMVFLGALCTILAIIISLIVPPSKPSSSTSGALGLFIQKLSLFETLFTTISVISVATVYSYLSDRTHHFYNEQMVFSWYELFALCQCLLIAAAVTVRRFSSYPASSDSRPTSYMKLSVTFLHEWKGLVVCLALISNITGLDKPLISDYTPGVIFSELMEISWLFAEVYEFTARCLEDTSSVSFAQYIVLNLRTALLPAVLSWVLNTSYFFYPLAAKLQFWYLFIFLTFKVLDFNNVIPSSYSGQIPGTKSVYVQLFKVFFMAIGAMATISMILHPILSSQLFPVNLYRDFFILIIAVFWSTYQNAESSSSTQSDQAKSDYTSSSRITCPSTFTVFLGVCAIGFFTNLCFISFSFAEPEEYITEWHTACSLAFIFGYVVLRSYILYKTDGLYISLWTYISSCSFELFVLRYHIFLNGDFSTRLYLISTGTNSTYFSKAGFYLYENLHDIYNLILVTLLFVFICKGIGFSWIKLITLLESTSDDMYSARGSRMPWILPDISFLSARSRNNNTSSSTNLASNSSPDINYTMENKNSTEFSQYDLESPISFNSMDGIKESDLTDGDESISHK